MESSMAEEMLEEDAAKDARVLICRIIDKVNAIIYAAEIIPIIQYSPPPLIGGRSHNIDLVLNIFNLHRFQIHPNHLIDSIDRAIGIYTDNHHASVVRMLNPFYYIGFCFEAMSQIPFDILGKAGFNQNKIQHSLVGRIAKGIIYMFGALASVLTVLQLLGLLERFKQVFMSILRLKT